MNPKQKKNKMTSVRIHLYYANEFDMDKIWDLLLKFFKID